MMDNEQFNLWINEIAQDRSRGASELARRCLTMLADLAQTLPGHDPITFKQHLTDSAQRLAAIRPSMAPIQNLLTRWQQALYDLADSDVETLRYNAVERALQLVEASHKAVTAIAQHSADHIGYGKTLLTHSLSSTVVAVCQQLKDRQLKMIITESRPLCEGRRLGEILSRLAIPTRYITEAQIGLFISQADAVLVGADSVLADGSIINKVGTYLVALAARDHQVPFYTCHESFKRRLVPTELDLEEMATTELHLPQWPHVTPRNIYFDITPAHLISGWITEQGVAMASGL